MNRSNQCAFSMVCISVVLTLACQFSNKAQKSGPEADGPWKSEARQGGPFVKGRTGPYLPFSGIHQKDGKVQNEVNLYGFGMDRWEDGKQVTSTWEKWELKCQDPCYTPMFADKGVYCQLERIIIYTGSTLSQIDIQRYSTLEGNLKVTRADWKAGVLNFEFGNPMEGSPVQCELMYEQIGDAVHLRSFRGAAIKQSDISGKMFTVEYRPAEYSYTLNVPVAMIGMKPGKQ